MSLVGTRPILQDELRQYELHHRARIAINADAVGAYNILRKYHSVSGVKRELSVTGLKTPEIIKVAV